MTSEPSQQEIKELKLRLQNCLQTILDLKGDLDSTPFGESFLPELGLLEMFLKNLVHIKVSEEEVWRVELATGHFLSELRPLMEKTNTPSTDASSVLQ